MTTYTLPIDGRAVPTNDHFEVVNPANGGVVGLAPQATSAHLEQAIKAADQAFGKWSDRSDKKRRQACRDISATIGEHAEELARLLTREQGKALNGFGSRWEVGGAMAWTDHTASLKLATKTIQDGPGGRIKQYRNPIGVVASITPWNFPLLIAIWHIIPAIRAGNTVVVKPSPFTPLSTIRLVELMNEVLPKGVVNCVTGPDTLGPQLTTDERIGKIVFTGSCATGQQVMRSAADTMKRLTLELGGNDAGIVLPDADPTQVAEGIFWGAFINGGQTCAALKRLYVHRDLHDDLTRELVAYAAEVNVGDGLDEETLIGPIQNRRQFDRVSDLVDSAKQAGGEFVAGGPVDADTEPGLFHPVTLVTGLENGDRLVNEEQFGPVLPIVEYGDVADAIAMANDSPFGLGGSVWGSRIKKARKVARQLECGSVWVNQHGMIQPNAPFGGTKSSGIGVEFGQEGLHEFTDIQVVFS